MINPYASQIKVEVDLKTYMDDYYGSNEGEATEILNPYTGVLEVKKEFPDVEYLDLDEMPDKYHSATTETDKKEKSPNSKKKRKRKWRDTNKQEWLNIYKQYMQERLKPIPRASVRVPQKLSRNDCDWSERKKKFDKKHKALDNDNDESDKEFSIVVVKEDDESVWNTTASVGSNDDHGMQEEVYEPTDQDLGESAVEDDQEVIYLDSESDKDDEHEDVEYLNEDLKTSDDESARVSKPDKERRLGPGRPRDRAMMAALRAVTQRRFGLLRAARAFRVPLDGLCARVQRVQLPCYQKPRTRKAISKNNHCNLRLNTMKLIKYSNICLFKWTAKYFACFFCLQRFKYMSMLRSHAEAKHGYKEKHMKLVNHVHTFHKADITDLECAKCHAMVDSLTELRKHLERKHKIRFNPDDSLLVPYKLCSDTWTCQLCNQVFASKGLLQNHMDEHYLNHTCDTCSMGFPNARALKIHKTHAHNKPNCSICGITLQSSLLKRKHEWKVHGLRGPGTMPRFKCSYCPERFKYDYKRLRHLIEQHNAETDLYQCSFCPKIFLTVHWCTKHMNSLHRDEVNERL